MTAHAAQRLLAGTLLIVAAAAAGATRAGQPPAPSLEDVESEMQAQPNATLYVAKRIVTMDPRRSVGEAVAVLGDRVLAVGSLADLKHAAGDRPLAVDETFKDKVLVPGFVDRGLHPLLAALTLTAEIVSFDDWILPDGVHAAARDRSAFLARLAEADAKLADPKSLLLVWGWHEAFHGDLTRTDLDSIDRTRPILVWHRSGLALALNGAALDRYGVNADFLARQGEGAKAGSDLSRGRFEGQGAAAVLSLLGPAIATPERTRKGLALVETYLHSSGVTVAAAPTAALSGALRGTQGAAPGDGTRLLRTWLVPAAKTLAGLYPGDPQRMLAQTARIAEWGSGKTGFLPQQVELALDGDPLSRSMRLLKPQREGRDGAWTMDPDTFARVFEAYWDGGYQIQVEARGDGALELLLENLERQMSRRPRYDHRTAVVGLDLAREDQIRRLARLGATVVADPYLATALADRSGELGLSAEQADSLVPLGSAKRAGLPIALQSDLPMAPARPLLLMQSAVSRTTPGGRVAGADQRLAVEDALAAVTINAAYSLRLENEIGSIEPGKLANFTVLEADPLTVPSGQIDTIGVWGTVLEGRVQPVERPSLPARTAQSRPLRTPGIEPGGALAAVR